MQSSTFCLSKEHNGIFTFKFFNLIRKQIITLLLNYCAFKAQIRLHPWPLTLAKICQIWRNCSVFKSYFFSSFHFDFSWHLCFFIKCSGWYFERYISSDTSKTGNLVKQRKIQYFSLHMQKYRNILR